MGVEAGGHRPGGQREPEAEMQDVSLRAPSLKDRPGAWENGSEKFWG